MTRPASIIPMILGGALLCLEAPAGADDDLPASIEIADDNDLPASRQTLSDEELAEQRGGFTFQGMQIAFGADIRTYLDGELALHTTVSWTDAGAHTTQTVFGSLNQASADQLRAGILTSGGMTMRVGEASVFLANEGRTALIHRTDNGLQNILVNTANNVNATQLVDATLDITGYEAFAADMSAARLGFDLGALVGAAGSDALSN